MRIRRIRRRSSGPRLPTRFWPASRDSPSAPPTRGPYNFCHEPSGQDTSLLFKFLLTFRPRCSRSEAQKDSHAIQLRVEFALEGAIALRVRLDIAERRLQLTVLHREVAPANHAVAPQQRQSVVAALASALRRVG